MIRVGEVIKVFPSEGKVQVSYQDTDSSSLPLPMVAYGNEYLMPKIGDMVVTLHFQNGSSKGVCLGTYYGGDNSPKATSGYRKDVGEDAYMEFKNGILKLKADTISLSCDYATETVENILKRIENLEDKANDFESRISALESAI